MPGAVFFAAFAAERPTGSPIRAAVVFGKKGVDQDGFRQQDGFSLEPISPSGA